MQTVLRAPRKLEPQDRTASRRGWPQVGAHRAHRRRAAAWGARRSGFEPFILGSVVGLGLWALLLLPLLL